MGCLFSKCNVDVESARFAESYQFEIGPALGINSLNQLYYYLFIECYLFQEKAVMQQSGKLS